MSSENGTRLVRSKSTRPPAPGSTVKTSPAATAAVDLDACRSPAPPSITSVPSPLLQTRTSLSASPCTVSLPWTPTSTSLPAPPRSTLTELVADQAVAERGRADVERPRPAGGVLDVAHPGRSRWPSPVDVRRTAPDATTWPRIAPPGKAAVWTLRYVSPPRSAASCSGSSASPVAANVNPVAVGASPVGAEVHDDRAVDPERGAVDVEPGHVGGRDAVHGHGDVERVGDVVVSDRGTCRWRCWTSAAPPGRRPGWRSGPGRWRPRLTATGVVYAE